MFLGHFAVALAAKRVAPRASLGALVFAAQFADLLWPLLLLLGTEQAHVQSGATVVTPLVFEHYPWSHSLLTLAVAGAVLGILYWFWRRRWREAVVLGLLVPSHWLLDWPMHAPDLPLAPGANGLYGLGLWNSLPVTLMSELGLFAIGVAIYLRATQPCDRIGSWALCGLLVFLGVVYLGNVFGPPPPNIQAVAWTALAMWLLVLWAHWADRHRDVVGNSA